MEEHQYSFYNGKLKENDLYRLTEFFKMLGNPTCILILLLLMGQDKNVSDLSKLLGFTQSTVSHQLNLLKANKMIRRYKDGKKVFYALVDKNVSKVIEEARHILFDKNLSTNFYSEYLLQRDHLFQFPVL